MKCPIKYNTGNSLNLEKLEEGKVDIYVLYIYILKKKKIRYRLQIYLVAHAPTWRLNMYRAVFEAMAAGQRMSWKLKVSKFY